MIAKINIYYQQFMIILDYNTDPRVKNFFLIRSPWPLLLLSTSYFILCRKLLPYFMKTRKAIDLKFLLTCFNFYHLTLSLVLFIIYIYFLIVEPSMRNIFCQRFDDSNNEIPLMMTKFAYVFFLFKLTDFSETFILILSKKHLGMVPFTTFHHIFIAWGAWGITKFYPTGHSLYIVFFISFNHIILMIYYNLHDLVPTLRVKRGFKIFKIIIPVQLVTLILSGLLHPLVLFIKNDCNYPISYAYWTVLFAPCYVIFHLHYRCKAVLE